MYKSQFKKNDPYDWFCGPGPHMLFTIVKFTSVQIPNSMYKYLSYDGQRIVMEVVIVQAEKTETV